MHQSRKLGVARVLKGSRERLRLGQVGELLLHDLLRLRECKRQRRVVRSRTIGAQQRQVPVGMDHQDFVDGQNIGLGAAFLAPEVHARLAAGEEDEVAQAQSAAEDLRHMPIGHQQALADHEASSGIATPAHLSWPRARPGIRFNEHIEGDFDTMPSSPHLARMGEDGRAIRKDSTYRSGRSPDWLKMKNPDAPAVTREAEEDWGKGVCSSPGCGGLVCALVNADRKIGTGIGTGRNGKGRFYLVKQDEDIRLSR